MPKDLLRSIHYPFLFLALISGLWSHAQKFSGRVYGPDAVIEDALVQNLSSGEYVTTTVSGEFSLQAEREDSIMVSAPFYESKILKIGEEQLAKPWVVELKMDLNQLEEVKVSKTRDKVFDITAYNRQLNEGIKEDMKAHPGKYGMAPSGSMDFIKIAGLLVSLFKKKKKGDNKKKLPEVKLEQLEKLLKTDALINEQLLTERFKIPKKYHGLFLDYCVQSGIDPALLATGDHFQLLDVLVKYNIEFQKILTDNRAQEGSQ